MLKDAKEPRAKALADRAAGELALMYARLGLAEKLQTHLASLEGRTIVGSATEQIAGARQGLWTMRHVPGIAFRCGPLALDRIRANADPNLAGHQYIQGAHSTTNGFSLSQLQQLSRDLGMAYVMAFREPGAPVILRAVVHWKVGHFAALLRQDGKQYLVQDPTFGSRNDI